MRLLLMALALSVFQFSCKKDDSSGGVPVCIQQRVQAFSTSEMLCNDARVDEYFFQARIVYVFSFGSCITDGASGVYDRSCKAIGSLGGIAGNTTVNGESFSHAVHIKTIWSK